MEWLATILTSNNAVSLVIMAIVIIIIIAILAKFGIVSFKNANLSIGKVQDNERTIIRQQIEYAENTCMNFISLRNITDEGELYKIRYVNERLYDEMVKWISFNHITTDDTYVEIKQNIIWSIISGHLIGDSYYNSDEFHQLCDEEVFVIIKKLTDIRKYYSKIG